MTASPEKVQAVFSDVASVYDKMNDLMSLGLHHTWKDIFVGQLPLKRQKMPLKILDMATGTGDIAARIQRRLNREKIDAALTLCDHNATMLFEGKNKHGRQKWSWQQEDATQLTIPANTFDLYVVSFGLRNMMPLHVALREAYRVLKPGGWFCCLEFSHPTSPWIEGLYQLYAKTWLPFLGWTVAKKPSAYTYLTESIADFPKATLLEEFIQHTGFKKCAHTLLSQGIVAMHWGKK